MRVSMTFGETISATRKQLGLTQKDLAERVQKNDGESITPQYLNDIEHDRRSPSSPEMIEQLAQALQLHSEVLYYRSGTLPEDVKKDSVSDARIVAAFGEFRKALRK